jgi:hypothetical protein
VLRVLLETGRILGAKSGLHQRRGNEWLAARGSAVVATIPWPAGRPLDAASWEQTPPVVQQWVVQRLTVMGPHAERIQALEGRLAAREARGQRNSSNAARPPSSDPPWVNANTPGETKRTPGARPGHPGHRQALLKPTAVIEVRPTSCPCGQTELPDPTPDDTHHVIERPAIQMIVRHVVWQEARCRQCGRVTNAPVPPQASAGPGPRLPGGSGAGVLPVGRRGADPPGGDSTGGGSGLGSPHPV